MPRWYSRGPRSYMGSAPEAQDSSALDMPAGSGVYLTAIRFPEWANWREGDFRGAEAVLFRDSAEVAKVSAGTRPDPERIRILDGRLWTDVADGGTTEIYCDGRHRLTIPGEELIKDIFTENGSVHTLGQRPGGSGLCYRVDGEEVFSSDAGSVTGGFSRDTSGTYFVYGIPIRKGESAKMEYHIMKGADEMKTIFPTEKGYIYDIRVRDGTVFRSERRDESPESLCLIMGDSFYSVDVSPVEEIHLCKLVETDGEMAIKGYSVQPNVTWHWIRSKDGVMYQVVTGSVPDFYVCEGMKAYIINDHNGFVQNIYLDGRYYGVEEGRFKIPSSKCADFRDGIFAAAISDASGQDHLLFIDGLFIPLQFNGYITSVKICL